MEINGRMSTNSIKEAMRIEDAKNSLKEYLKDKFKHNMNHYQFIDLEARNAFKNKEVTASVIKCAHGFNHYGVRNAMINNNLTEKECPRCNAIETWDHVIRCPKVRNMQREFIAETAKELFKKNKGKISKDDMLDMLEDIVKFFNGGEEEENAEEFETSQQHVGMKELFRGCVVRDWKQADFNCTKYADLNRILVRSAVLFCNKCWKHRNECLHDAEMQRKRIISWHDKIKEKVENDEPPTVKLFAMRNKIDAERCSTETIRVWIYNVKEIIKKAEKLPRGDIRRFFEM